MIKGLADSKAIVSNLRDIQVRDIVKEVEVYLKTYSPTEMDMRWVILHYPIISDTVPPIPPPFGANTGNPDSSIRAGNPTDTINNTTSTSGAQNVVDENLPQLLDSRGGSHVTNIPGFDEEDFSSWKDRFLIYLDGLEPYLLEILENGPFVPLSPLSTSTNPLSKPHNDRRLANQDKRLKSILISCLPTNVMKSVIKCTSAKATWTALILTHEGPSEIKDTKIATLRLKFNAFKALEGDKVNGTFTRLRSLLNDLENNGVFIPQAEVNATFVNSLPRKWLSMNQTQRANNSIKNDTLTVLYGKYNYEEGLIDQIYESESTRFTLQGSKALISNPTMQESDSDIEEDQRRSSEFLANLNVEFHERALLATQRRFYKRSGRVGSQKKIMDKTNETCFACGKSGHFQKECLSLKTSTPSYPSSNKSYNKHKFHTNITPQHNQNVNKKDYRVKYKGLKAEIAFLTKKIDAMNKGKSEKGLVVESFNMDEESMSSNDEVVTTFKALMAVADEPSVGRVDVVSGQWVEITMNKVQKLLSITNSEERKHVLDYTHVDLHYVEDQRKKLLSKYNSLKQEFSSCKSELSDLKNTKALNSSFQITLDQLLTEQITRNIVKAIGGKGTRKEKISSKEVVFTKSNVSSETCLEIPSDSESEGNTQIPLPSLPKLIGAEPSGVTKCLTLNNTKQTTDKVVPLTVKQKAETKPTPDLITEKLLFNLMEEVKGKDKIWFGPCKHCGLKNHLSEDCYKNPKCSTCGSSDHLTKEHPEQIVVKRTLAKLHAQPSQGSSRKAPMIPKPYIPCKYYGFNDHHFDECEFYPRCDLCGSIAHETSDCVKRTSMRKPRVALKYSKESDPKVIFRDNFLGDTEGYGSVNYNGITFTKVAYVNGLKHNLISISQLCDANFCLQRLGEPYSTKTKKLKIENLNEVKVKELRSDNGTEFKNFKLEEFCDEKGISQNFSSPCTPEQNGVAEKSNRTLIEATRTMLNKEGLQISYFHVFGYPVHIRNHKDHLGKFDEKANDGFFLGYSLVAKAFRTTEALPTPTTLSQTTNPLAPQDRWSRDRHIGLVNIIGEPLDGKYVKDLLKTFELAHSASVKCPMLPPNNLGPDESWVSVNETLFRGMIGSLMYLIASRPDIQFSVCLCARYQANPKESHLVAVKRIFRYLKGTPNLGLWYPKGSGFDLKAYSDSDYAGCNLDRKSAFGGCLVSFHQRDYILKGDIELHFVPTDLQLADIFTKPLAEPSFTRLVAELGMLNITSEVSDKKEALNDDLN
ncbi:retrovirus-related pol polyprotein from transposon TNT 1-94 [Tanacetum coccineum]